jgi:RimJ/RimL family protein N-acetyltransferase
VEDYSEYPKQVELNDGTRVFLRPMHCGDKDRLRVFFRQLSQRNRRYFKRDAVLEEVIGQWCQQLDYEQVLPVLAMAGDGKADRILADGTLHTESHGSSAHVARIRWVVADDMLQRGLGRLLVRELLRRAHSRGIQKIQANLLTQDRQSILLLHRLGFRKEAVFRRHAMDLRGRLHDVVVMAKDIEQQWQKMNDANMEFEFCQKP